MQNLIVFFDPVRSLYVSQSFSHLLLKLSLSTNKHVYWKYFHRMKIFTLLIIAYLVPSLSYFSLGFSAALNLVKCIYYVYISILFPSLSSSVINSRIIGSVTFRRYSKILCIGVQCLLEYEHAFQRVSVYEMYVQIGLKRHNICSLYSTTRTFRMWELYFWTLWNVYQDWRYKERYNNLFNILGLRSIRGFFAFSWDTVFRTFWI